MSGGFFRGTSADQDTRFSNKQAKLLKTQKFAPELEHLVDMTKVKMDVMKPWIATRVTEILGFEDEVLINFIFGLLEGKVANGKEVQISLTGFMEKNTGKFMKELWSLLLSAQQTSSGVPQQFLDAKEEETRKKKEEADRIADEIRKKKEKESRDIDQERVRKMDGVVEKKTGKELSPQTSNGHPNEKSNSIRRDGERGATSERLRSRSLSNSPRARSHSVSPRRPSSDTRRRYSPHRSRSPPRRSSTYCRRSRSPLRHRSPSPARRRLQSPRHRSRSPGHRRHRRTPSPGQRPSPVRRRRSPSPVRRRRSPSPVRRRRSPSPVRRRRSPSPVKRRRSPSPVRRRRTPPVRRRRTPSPDSSSPLHQRSLSVESNRSLSPVRHRSSFARRRSPSSAHERSPSPIHPRSPSPVHGRSGSPSNRKPLSPVLDKLPLPLQNTSPSFQRGDSLPISRKQRSLSTSSEESPIPARQRSPPTARRRGRSVTLSEKSLSLKSSSPSPANCGSLSPLRKRSPGVSSKGKTRERSLGPYKNPKKQDRKLLEDKRPTSPYKSPSWQIKDPVRRDDSPSPEEPGNRRLRLDSPERLEANRNARQKISEYSSSLGKHRESQWKMENKGGSPTAEARGNRISLSGVHVDSTASRNKDLEKERVKSSVTRAYSENVDRIKSQNIDQDSPVKKRVTDQAGNAKSDDKDLKLSNSAKEDSRRRLRVMEEQVGVSVVGVPNGSDDNNRGRREKGSNKRSKKHDTESDEESYDSEAVDRKEAKRRRRAEKKLRKEEKRRRREERRRKRVERHAEKHKLKREDVSSPSEEGRYQRDADAWDNPHVKRKENCTEEDEAEAQKKKLEIELRLKALESFKAKKGNGR